MRLEDDRSLFGCSRMAVEELGGTRPLQAELGSFQHTLTVRESAIEVSGRVVGTTRTSAMRPISPSSRALLSKIWTTCQPLATGPAGKSSRLDGVGAEP